MKKILILILFAAVYLHFYPQPELNAFYEKHKADFLSSIAEATDTKVRLKSDKIFKDLQSEFKQFSPQEIESLKDITSSRDKVEAFFDKYCDGGEYNATFHRVNLGKVCRVIESYQGLL